MKDLDVHYVLRSWVVEVLENYRKIVDKNI